MDKIVNPGKMLIGNIFCRVKIENGKKSVTLSITGVIGPMQSGDARGGCGQIDMFFQHRNPAHNDKHYHHLTTPEEITFAAGWTKDLWLDFLEVWHDWHLNDARSACEHQRAAGVSYDSDPKNVCPTCGYRIGTKWLYEPLPEKVTDFLNSLPATQVQPAWV